MTLAHLPSQPKKKSATPKERIVFKRSGEAVAWNPDRILRAVALAFYADQHGEQSHNENADNPDRLFGLTPEAYMDVKRVVELVSNSIAPRFETGDKITVEAVQDVVELMLMAAGHHAIAKRYVLYRAKQSELRLSSQEPNGLSDYIVMSKYARYREDLGRRELWPEAARRVFDMHRTFFSSHLNKTVTLLGKPLSAVIDDVERDLANKQVLGSMRSVQFGGSAILKNHARMFNCSFGHIDDIRRFSQSLWLLLCGTGVGFSVQKHHVAKIPAFPARKDEWELPVKHVRIVDTIEGWADALHELIMSYYEGVHVEFDYSAIRPRGSLLKTSGGRAPGHIPLRKALENARKILNKVSGRSMKPIEAYDLIMFAAEAVLSGGIRRSATIALFSPDDEDMMMAKTGDWWKLEPQRSGSNNSALIVRAKGKKEDYNKLFEALKSYGEPGFYFSESEEYGANPCVEIGLAPFLTVTEADIAKLRKYGYSEDVKVGDRLGGFQMCNLSTINGRECTTPERFYELCTSATVIGTLQAAYSVMDYLGPVTRVINEREALLGVSICGILDRPDVLLDPKVLQTGAKRCIEVNRAVAAVIGTNPAARITCVKPEGTASLVLECGSGVHPHHAKHYFRRVQASRVEPIYQYFKSINPHMTEPHADPNKAQTTDVITFTVTAPDGAILRKDIGGIQFLDIVRLVQKNWVEAGTADETHNPGLRHNVSNTVTVRDDEWPEVQEYLWKNRKYFTGVSLLGEFGDKAYKQAPREQVTTPQDIAIWHLLEYAPVDYAAMREAEDQTDLKSVVACAGGACEINI